jgi:hypothetical protein
MSMNYDIESDNNAHRTPRELTHILFYIFFSEQPTPDSESNDENEEMSKIVVPSHYEHGASRVCGRRVVPI